MKRRHGGIMGAWIEAIQLLKTFTPSFFTLSSLTQILPAFIHIILSSHLPPSLLFVQCLCPALRDSQSWGTTTAPCLRRTLAPPVWSGPSSRTTLCSTRAEGWATTATAGTRTGSPTPGASLDKTLEPSDGPTATATRVRLRISRLVTFTVISFCFIALP